MCGKSLEPPTHSNHFTTKIFILKVYKFMNTSPNTQTKRRFYTKGTPTEAQKEAAKAKRDELKALSKGIKLLVKEGKYDTINEGLVELYADNGHMNLNTMHQWNELNMNVKKEEKALS